MERSFNNNYLGWPSIPNRNDSLVHGRKLAKQTRSVDLNLRAGNPCFQVKINNQERKTDRMSTGTSKFSIIRMSTDRRLRTFPSYELARDHWLKLKDKEEFIVVAGGKNSDSLAL